MIIGRINLWRDGRSLYDFYFPWVWDVLDDLEVVWYSTSGNIFGDNVPITHAS